MTELLAYSSCEQISPFYLGLSEWLRIIYLSNFKNISRMRLYPIFWLSRRLSSLIEV